MLFPECNYQGPVGSSCHLVLLSLHYCEAGVCEEDGTICCCSSAKRVWDLSGKFPCTSGVDANRVSLESCWGLRQAFLYPVGRSRFMRYLRLLAAA